MKERPILFSGEMVRAILDGRKTQTRRVIKGNPSRVQWNPVVLNGYGGWTDEHGKPLPCPYGVPGDLLWVRETWARHCIGGEDYIFYRVDSAPDGDGAPWKPSIHMPRWASRITLRVVDVRVERVQEISDDDAKAEGVNAWHDTKNGTVYRPEFRLLWDSINVNRGFGWDANPWVWVVEFEVVK